MRTKNLKNVWWPNTNEHLDVGKSWKITCDQKLPGRSCVSAGSSPESSSLLRLLPSQICHRTGTSQRPTGGMSCLALLCSKGVHTRMLSLLSVNVQKIIQNFNQFQSSFASFLSQSLERSSEKSPKDRLFYV
jgi:hypothetical protein